MTGSAVLDVVLVLLLVLYAWSGWRQGFVSAVLGLVGLLVGAFLALRFVPDLFADHLGVERGTVLGALFLVVVVLAAASLGQGLMLVLAGRLRDTVRAPAARVVDSALGMVAVLAASVLVIWVVAGAVRTSGPQPLRQAVARSTVVTTIDAIVPPAATRFVDQVTEALDREGFPRVFEGLGPEPIASIAAPDPALASDPDIRRALASVIHVRAEAPSCGQVQVGSGWVASSGHVVTNAHVVAGASRVSVSVDGTGPERAATVVAIDPERDVAVLDVPGLRAPALRAGDQLGAGDDAVVAGFPGDQGLFVGPARVRGVLTATGADIYGRPGVAREIYSLRADIRKGASGGPVLDGSGRVVGMVFATSLDDPQTGYALTLDEVLPVLRAGERATSPVPAGTCTAA
ncbi:MAG TPA: MarP family serine protease [Phycicoccus sp.]